MIMQRHEIRKYFGRNYFATCQHCGQRIYKRNRNGYGQHSWLAYSKTAYRDDAEYEVLCRGFYDEAVKANGPMISRDALLKKIDRWVVAEAKREKQVKETATKAVKEVEKTTEHIQFIQPSLQPNPIQDHVSFKPYPIYTKGNVSSLLNAYRKYQKQQNEQNQRNQQKQCSVASDEERTILDFLTFITHFTGGAGMTKRPVRLDAAHKYIERWFCEEREGRETHGRDWVDIKPDLISIADFFSAMAELKMIRDSVAKKAKNICLKLAEADGEVLT